MPELEVAEMIMNEAEAAEFLECSESTLFEYVRNNLIAPVEETVGGPKHFRTSDLAALKATVEDWKRQRAASANAD